MRTIIPGDIPTRDLHQFLLGSVSPRPIAFVSTINEDGVDNLAPYSFFNCFSSNPPIFVFSSNRRVVNNTTKDTLANVMNQKECVINVVNHEIVKQMTITSIEFPTEQSEFIKSGLTPIESSFIKAKRVSESPVQMECKVNDIIPLGEHGGAGHLIICEMLAMHINEDVIDPESDRIDPHKIDLMGRMGRSYYVRASGAAIHTIYQPVTKVTIGYDALPDTIKKSTILSANDIAMLSGMEQFPSPDYIDSIIDKYGKLSLEERQLKARTLLKENKRAEAYALAQKTS